MRSFIVTYHAVKEDEKIIAKTQNELAKKLGVTRQAISKAFENEKPVKGYSLSKK